MASGTERPPHARLPLLYFSLAHVCLGSAFAALAAWPSSFAAFFYHPHMVAVVHLVTLGWISASILGALYMIAPMALRTRLPARASDHAAFALYGIGVVGMVSHFWIDSPRGMVWSAGSAALALLWATGRAAFALRAAPIPTAVKLHFYLAFLNLATAATLGVLLGLNKVRPVIGGFVLSNVYAHAHLAALGWATMMVMAAGYRLLPMLLPSAMPEGRRLYASAVLLEAGTLGLFASLLARSRAVALFAPLAAAGILAFLLQVAWMKRHPRPAPKELRRPDWGVLHALQALLWLAVATGLGMVLAFARSPSGRSGRLSSTAPSVWSDSSRRSWWASANGSCRSMPGCGPTSRPGSRSSRDRRTLLRSGLSRPRRSCYGAPAYPSWRRGSGQSGPGSSRPERRRSSRR